MTTSRYHRHIMCDTDGKSDVYDVLRAFAVTDPAVAHAIKKLLAPGQRHAKGYLQDLEEAAWSLSNAIEHAKRTAVPDQVADAG